MGSEIFENAKSKLQTEKDLANLNKLSLKELNNLYFKLSLISNVPFKIEFQSDRRETIKKLNSMRYWISRRILLDKNILAYIVFGKPDEIKETFRLLFKFGLYLPKDQYLNAINNFWDSIKYINSISQKNVYEIILENLLINPYGRILHLDLLEHQLEDKILPLELTLLPTSNINDVKNINNQIKEWINNENYQINLNDKFIITDHTINKTINNDMYDLRANIHSMIRDVCTNPDIYLNTYKDNIVSLSFDWITNSNFGPKSKEEYADIVITKQTQKPPDNIRYKHLTILGFYWYFYIGINLNSSRNGVRQNFKLVRDTAHDKFILSLPSNWKIVRQFKDYLFILAPDLMINRLKAKRIRSLKFKPIVKINQVK